MNMGFCALNPKGLIFAFFLAGSLLCAQDQQQAAVSKSDRRAFAPPLSQMKPIPAASRPSESVSDDADANDPGHSPHPTLPVEDSALQRSSDESSELSGVSTDATTNRLTTNSVLNILGLGYGFKGYTPNLSTNIPDTNGAVGKTQFVQVVNDSFVVLNKSTGAVEYGPAHTNTLWQSMGGSCASEPNLDAIAQYDKIANVWVMMMPAWTNPSKVCIAVSTTSDATNASWNLYQFQPPVNSSCQCRPLFDYPKLAVWPNGYYLSWNEIVNGNFIGSEACVVNRSAMLAGNSAAMQCFSVTSGTAGSMLPADLDGPNPPPSGSPEYFLNFDINDENLELWEFHTNWTNPSLSTFSGPTKIPVAAFNEACGETVVEFTYTTGDCIPQKGTSIKLDSYGDRIMYRLAYRNFGSYQAIVTNHTVQVSTSSNQTGLRWYELKNTGSGFELYQHGTYAPNSSYRWMGSIAMDHVGDIAMGYSVSNSSMGPSIRYTGRVPSDTLGTMESEIDVLAAAGITPASRTNNFRWADYSSMAIDPSNDCTFWYTTEYIPVNGGLWSTRIAAFKFPNCSDNTKSSGSWTLVHKTSQASVHSLTIPATGSDHLIAVALMFNGKTSVSSVSDNARNTYESAAGARAVNGSNSVEIWYARNSTAGATVVTPKFGVAPSLLSMTAWEISGMPTISIDAVNTAAGSLSHNNTAGPLVTTSNTGDFVISVMFALNSNLSAISTGNNFTNDFTTFGNGWAHLTNNSSSPRNQQASWFTANPAGAYCASTVAFAP
jgi:hypothetical protein